MYLCFNIYLVNNDIIDSILYVIVLNIYKYNIYYKYIYIYIYILYI